jgi:hypothetical protein
MIIVHKNIIVNAEDEPYLIEDIEWPTGHDDLPDEAVIDLPWNLVGANEIDDDEWDACIVQALATKFGVSPIEFGSFGPAE